MSVDDPVEDYVRSLGRRLRGPWRMRRGLLTEVRGGLDDAAEALVENGRSWTEARRVAVDEFGSVAELAPQFQRELAVRQAKWTAAWVALTLPTLHVAWDLTWSTAPDLGIAPPVISVLARMTDVVSLSTALLCVVALLVLELAGRRVRTPERLARAVAGATLVGVLCIVALSAAMTTLNMRETTATFDASPGYRAVAIASLIAIVIALSSAIRCARAATPDPAERIPSASGSTVAVR